MAQQKDYTGILIAGAAVAAFVVLKPVVQGEQNLVDYISNNTPDDNAVKDAKNNIAANNPFSYMFAPFQANMANNYNKSSASDQSAFFNALQDPLKNLMFKTANDILSAMHWYHPVDEQTVLNAFNNFSTQVEVAFVAAIFHYVYARDFLDYLNYGEKIGMVINHGLTNTVLARLINQINNLPVQ
jgi:hypothetical protein